MNAPPVTQMNSPVPEISMQLLLSRPRLIQDLDQNLERFVLFAKKSAMNFDENLALDEEYQESLVDLYEHIWKHYNLQLACDGKRGKRGLCTGPANIVVRVCDSTVFFYSVFEISSLS